MIDVYTVRIIYSRYLINNSIFGIHLKYTTRTWNECVLPLHTSYTYIYIARKTLRNESSSHRVFDVGDYTTTTMVFNRVFCRCPDSSRCYFLRSYIYYYYNMIWHIIMYLYTQWTTIIVIHLWIVMQTIYSTFWVFWLFGANIYYSLMVYNNALCYVAKSSR